ncbi:MAG: LysM peptidoglycan-binding domain-containing protein, partial [Methylococcaceae bacterium]|nr:LysM peptidoglycan-binding domain-containing protein [Methylococcaceae bacterium]
ILTQIDLVEYSCRFSVRTGLLALLLFVLLPGCSQKAGFKRSVSEIDHSPLSGLSAKQGDTDWAGFGKPVASGKKKGTRPEFDNLWQRIVSLYALPREYNFQIERQLQWFLKNPDYLDRVQRRAEPYLFEIVEQIENQGIPGEFALLPIVESAFQPYAYSHADASGIWQFIPSTARLYGLQQNWWYDGRRDIDAATQAAIRYLQKLNRDFNGDWLLSLAAYNCGEGAVQNAINWNWRRHRPADFWSLNLPRETRDYVPRLLAVSRLFANAERYGIRLHPVKNRPYFKKITAASQIDLKMAAELAGISMHKLYQLNPGYNQWASSPYGPHRLLIPMENAKLFSEKVDKLSEVTKVQWRRHRINHGDSIESIAEDYGASVDNILKANQLSDTRLDPGTHLIVPLSDEELAHYNYFPNPNTPKRSLPKRITRSSREKIFYTVRRGDTLSKIARRYAVNPKDLARWNGLGRRSVIRPGTRLAIASRNSVSRKSASYGFRSYTVKKGDSLTKLARRFKVSVADLRKWNKPRTGKILIPGQRIKVHSRPAG